MAGIRFTFSIQWLPWQATVSGPARVDEHRNLYLAVEKGFERLPAVGETIFFEDGGWGQVESIGWKLDGNAFLFLGRRFEKKGEALALWEGRGFRERESREGEAPPTKDLPA